MVYLAGIFTEAIMNDPDAWPPHYSGWERLAWPGVLIFGAVFWYSVFILLF